MTNNTITATIAGLTAAQTETVAGHGPEAVTKCKKLAIARRAAFVASLPAGNPVTDAAIAEILEDPMAWEPMGADLDACPFCGAAGGGGEAEACGACLDAQPADNAGWLGMLSAPAEPEEVALTLDATPGEEAPETYLARLMGETAPDGLAVTVDRIRSGVAALNGKAKGLPGVNGHAMVRKGMREGSGSHACFGHALYAAGFAVGDVLIAHQSSGHVERIWVAAPSVGGSKVIAWPSIPSAWLSPAGQAGFLVSVGRGRWEIQPAAFDALSSGQLAELAGVRALNRAAASMGPDRDNPTDWPQA